MLCARGGAPASGLHAPSPIDGAIGACMLSVSPVSSLGLTGPNKGLWVVGFLISVIFSFLAALGLNMQKQSIREHAAENPSLPTWRQPVRRLRRVCGHTTSQ